MIDVSNEAVMAAGQAETHGCCDVAQGRLKQIKQIVAGQNCCGGGNILIGCGKYQWAEPKNYDFLVKCCLKTSSNLMKFNITILYIIIY